MAHGTYAANALHQIGHFVVGAALHELLKSAQLRGVKVRLAHLSLIVQLQGDLGVAFDSGDWIDGDGFSH